jgi:hypothetical protein
VWTLFDGKNEKKLGTNWKGTRMKRLAIVGAGLCGVAFFVHLARQLQGRQGMDLELRQHAKSLAELVARAIVLRGLAWIATACGLAMTPALSS